MLGFPGVRPTMRDGLSRRALLASLGSAAMATATTRQAWATSYEDVVAGAKREGKLVYWAPEEIPLIRAAAERFNAAYPGIEVTHFRIQPGPAAERIISEAQAGQVNVDSFDMPLLYMPPILDRGLAEPFDWHAVFGTDPAYIFYDNRAVSNWDLESPICINTDLVKPGEITSWNDLLQPKWKGKVLLEARGLMLAILMAKWGEQPTIDYINKLKDNKAVILVGGSPTAEALASGRVSVALGTYSSKIDLMRKAGAPVDWLTVGPIPSMMYVNCVAKGCAHPNAARLWAGWMTTERGAKDVWETMNFGFVHGNHISPNGEKMRAAGAEIVLESTDPVLNQHRLSITTAAIGALK